MLLKSKVQQNCYNLKHSQVNFGDCMEQSFIKKCEIDTASMGFWSMVHELVPLANRNHFTKLAESDQVIKNMNKALGWLINSVDIQSRNKK